MTQIFSSVQQAPSHIIADGTRVFLPPASTQEKAFFFARSVAKHNLVSVTSSSKDTTTITDEDRIETERIKEEQNEEATNVIHPLAKASATLESNGIAELSKAINLSTLVQTGEYFTFGNIVDSSLVSTDKGDKMVVVAANVGSSSGPSPTTTISSSSSVAAAVVGVAGDQEEMKLRSNYVLKRKRQQFQNAKDALYQHHKRLKVATAAQRVIDKRLLQLRNRWKMDVPEHPLIPVPIRPDEVVCIDVDVYQNHHDRSNGGNYGKIARKVPRYATIELSNDFDIMVELKRRKEEQKQLTMEEEEEENDKEEEVRNEEKERNEVPPTNITDSTEPVADSSPSQKKVFDHDTFKDNTRALPFQLADPAIGDVDLDFDPDDVPILRLVFQIEKSSTGFLHSVTLNPNDTTTRSNLEVKGQTDEAVLQSLQHSLFCANIFDMIRNELNHNNFITNETSVKTTASNVKGNSQNQSTVPPAWLNMDMEENFLPPTSLMSSTRSKSNVFGSFVTSPLSVIYCHDGEVKVQLNEEYSLIVKLEDTNKQVQVSDSSHDESTTGKSDQDSGSQSKNDLDILCRILLLHAQCVFHENKKLSVVENSIEARKDQANKISKVDYSVGTSNSQNKTKKKIDKDSFPILQSCVALGLKILMDRRVNRILSDLKVLQKIKFPELNFHVEYMKLPLFYAHSQIALSFLDSHCLDISVTGGSIQITSFTEAGSYRNVSFESDSAFKLFLKAEMKRCRRVLQNYQAST